MRIRWGSDFKRLTASGGLVQYRGSTVGTSTMWAPRRSARTKNGRIAASRARLTGSAGPYRTSSDPPGQCRQECRANYGDDQLTTQPSKLGDLIGPEPSAFGWLQTGV